MPTAWTIKVSRSGEIGALQDEGVDLACYLVRELQAMSMIARALGDTTNEEIYTTRKTLVGIDQ